MGKTYKDQKHTDKQYTKKYNKTNKEKEQEKYNEFAVLWKKYNE